MATAQNRAKERTIGSVVAHPLRARCLNRLAETTASPAELAHEFRKPLSDVSYHIATLLKAGAIELIGERPVRGSVEHFYRAIRLAWLDTEESAEMTLEQRLEFARQAFQLAAADATIAFDAKTYNRRPDSFTVRLPGILDEEAWSEMTELLTETEDRMVEIRARSDGRRATRPAGDETKDIPTTTFLAFFERPPR
jgi:DNA-binding transcriptional ArsR family regulator